jgi:cobalt-zinc-cadmium efflux system outer membrane protein
MKKRLLLIAAACCSFAFTVGAAEQKFNEYLSEAAKENAGIQAAYENWQSALSKVAYSNSLPDPKITYGHFIESVETRVGPQKFKLGLAQMIPWIGKLSSRKDVASQQASLAEMELALAYTELRLELTEAFLDLFYLQSSLRIQKDYIDLAKVIEQTAQSQTKVGGSGADVIQAQMELNRLQYELKTLEENELTAVARVNAILNKPVESRLDLPSDIDLLLVEPPAGVIAKRTNEELKVLNPKMKIIETQRSVQESRKKLVHQNRYPDVTVGVDWIKTDKAIMATPDSGKDPVIAFVSINVPIWQGTYRSQEKEVDAQVNRFSGLYRQHLYDLQARQEKILYSYSDARRRVELFRDLLVPEAEQSLSILTDAYKTGRADFERLQNAQITLLKLQLSLERARSDLGISVARYRALVGES